MYLHGLLRSTAECPRVTLVGQAYSLQPAYRSLHAVFEVAHVYDYVIRTAVGCECEEIGFCRGELTAMRAKTGEPAVHIVAFSGAHVFGAQYLPG